MDIFSHLFVAYLGVAALVIMTPGPDTAVTVRNTLLGGRVGGIFTALGVATGLAIWALSTSVGVVALLLASEPVFLAVKFAGAAYLIFLGAQSLLAAFRSQPAPRGLGEVSAVRRLAPWRAYRQGLVSDLGNPKMAAFFPSLLPQFTPPGDASFASLVILGLVFSAMTFVWLLVYATAVARAGAFLRRRRVRQILDGLTGAVLVGLGLRLAAEQR
ncbi:LysE family translocator [Reyranella sp. CPCC 100927]|uniref:LysE family translocator n=1 Tax=Reyranella sp. CPCC 100927 TaxID=2599616 RepID=UPI0011B80650|nr:LysE family translocator [Reyranella sp. CPCC 100927]TWT14818.1 LysE family translocator [Reyranella sp. CPCC 100927]